MFPGFRIERMVDRQIREAQERGAFDNLPGAGKPLGDLGRPRDENWWLRQYLIREGVSDVPFLPPALALRKEAEELPEAVAKLATEAQVRAIVAKLNERILDALKKPKDGPSMTLMQVDVERIVLDWRLSRIASNRPTLPPMAENQPRRRRFGRRKQRPRRS